MKIYLHKVGACSGEEGRGGVGRSGEERWSGEEG